MRSQSGNLNIQFPISTTPINCILHMLFANLWAVSPGFFGPVCFCLKRFSCFFVCVSQIYWSFLLYSSMRSGQTHSTTGFALPVPEACHRPSNFVAPTILAATASQTTPIYIEKKMGLQAMGGLEFVSRATNGCPPPGMLCSGFDAHSCPSR